MLKKFFYKESKRHTTMVQGQVVPDPARCVQCGICTYSCPVGIDVRRHAWNGQPVSHSHCITCGECVARCPRGALKFERTSLFEGTEK
jgi:ferredoxin